jgi:membrane protein required for colicin V production
MMEALGLTWFDAAALAIIVFSGIMGLARGLIREVFTIVGVVAAVVAAYYFAGPVAPLAQQMLGLDELWARVVGGFAVFLVVFIVITFLTMVIARSVHRSTEIGSVDRAAGLAFGVARGVLIIGLLIALITQGRPSSDTAADTAATPVGSARVGFELPREITEAKLYPIFAATAGVLRSILPKIVDESRTLIEENREGAQSAARELANEALERQKAREAQAEQQQPAQQPVQQPKQ